MISKNVVPTISYNGDNTTILYGIPFPTFEIESLKVYVSLLLDDTKTILVPDVDFSYANLGVNGVDGSITLIDSGQAWINALGGLDVQYSVTAEFDADSFQPSSFRSWTNSSPATLEKSLDRLTMNVKAIKNELEKIDQTQVDTNTQDIADLNAALAVASADIAALTIDLNILKTDYYSQASEIFDNSGGVTFGANIDSDLKKHMIFEYIIVRNGQVQYGREIVVNVTAGLFNMSPIEKVGEAGVTFAVTNGVGNVGTVRYSASSTGFDGEMYYKLYKFDKEVF